MTNMILGSFVTDVPAVGDGATELLYTDRAPYTVVDVVHGKKGVAIILRADKVTWKPWPDGYAASIDPDPDGYMLTVTKATSGKNKGKWVNGGTIFLMGKRDAYHDPHF